MRGTKPTQRVRALGVALVVVTVALAGGIVAHAAVASSPSSRASSSPASKHAAPIRHTSLRWEALGDSYSAGVGSDKGPDGCGDGHIDAPSASRAEATFAAESATPLKTFELLACGGATTASIERDQVPRTRDADIVTLTAGGNDIGFVRFVEKCFFLEPSGCPSQDQAGDVLDPGDHADHAGTWSALHQRLVDLYVTIRRTMQSGGYTGGQLFVMTYPIPFSVPDLQRGPSCWLFDHRYHSNALLANALTERLDDEIASAVTDAARVLHDDGVDPDVHLVDWRTRDGAAPVLHLSVRGKVRDVATNPDGICSGHAMTHLYRETFSARAGQDSFHPTQRGYDIGADRLLAALVGSFPRRDDHGGTGHPSPVAFCAVRRSGSSCRPAPAPAPAPPPTSS